MLELLVAMMIIAVIATLGMRKYNEFSAEARYIKAKDTLSMVGSGLDFYFTKHGRYPDYTSFEAMVEPNSVLVKENLIPVGIATVDPWKQSFEGKSDKSKYELKTAGDPGGSPDRPPYTLEPGKVSAEPGSQATPATPQGTK